MVPLSISSVSFFPLSRLDQRVSRSFVCVVNWLGRVYMEVVVFLWLLGRQGLSSVTMGLWDRPLETKTTVCSADHLVPI